MKKFITNLDLEKLILLVIGDETRPIPGGILLKKVISFEKLVIPRLKVFEEICPSSNE